MIEWAPVLRVSLAFGAVFIVAELWKTLLKPAPELTRKFVHLSGGIICSFFPFWFHSAGSVLLLCSLFVGLILAGRHFGKLQAVHGVARATEGAWCFPISVFGLFYIAHDTPVLYAISLLILAFADSFAAMVGQAYGRLAFDVETNQKTLEGSFTFWVVTFFCVHIPLLLFTTIGRAESLLVSLIVALLVTAVESVAFRGLDNLFVPFLAYYCLVRLTTKPLGELFVQTQIIALLLLLSFLFRIRAPLLRGSGQAGLVLLFYGAWSLCDQRWFWPLFLVALGLKMLTLWNAHSSSTLLSTFGARRFFLAGVGPFLLIFISNALKDYDRLYLPYIAGGIALGFVLSKRIVSVPPRSSEIEGIVRAALLLLWAALVPVACFERPHAAKALGVVIAAALPMIALHWRVEAKLTSRFPQGAAWLPLADYLITAALAVGFQSWVV